MESLPFSFESRRFVLRIVRLLATKGNGSLLRIVARNPTHRGASPRDSSNIQLLNRAIGNQGNPGLGTIEDLRDFHPKSIADFDNFAFGDRVVVNLDRQRRVELLVELKHRSGNEVKNAVDRHGALCEQNGKLGFDLEQASPVGDALGLIGDEFGFAHWTDSRNECDAYARQFSLIGSFYTAT